MDAYPLARAARFWGVPPWELAKQSVYWRDLALKIEAAESNAEREQAKREEAVASSKAKHVHV